MRSFAQLLSAAIAAKHAATPGGYSLRDLERDADALGVHVAYSYIGRLARGKARRPSDKRVRVQALAPYLPLEEAMLAARLPDDVRLSLRDRAAQALADWRYGIRRPSADGPEQEGDAQPGREPEAEGRAQQQPQHQQQAPARLACEPL